jgi:hypothetical protein
MLLNSMAFGTRRESINFIHATMRQRRKGLAEKSIIVSKNTEWRNVDRQVSSMGSVALGSGKTTKFRGWTEQQTGKKAIRVRVSTLIGRSGSKSRRIKPKARMKGKLVSPTRIPRTSRSGFNPPTIRDNNHRVFIMLRVLEKLKWKQPFIITGHNKIPPGLYRFGGEETKFGKGIQLLQGFDADRLQPRRLLWMSGGVRRWFAITDLNREFIKSARRLILQSRRPR